MCGKQIHIHLHTHACIEIIVHTCTCLYCMLYVVQWSKKEQFLPEAGEFILTDLRQKEYTIPGLENVSNDVLFLCSLFFSSLSYSLFSFLFSLLSLVSLLLFINSLSLSFCQGEAYYVRVSAFNMKGFGPPRISVPTYGIPSCKKHNCT